MEIFFVESSVGLLLTCQMKMKVSADLQIHAVYVCLWVDGCIHTVYCGTFLTCAVKCICSNMCHAYCTKNAATYCHFRRNFWPKILQPTKTSVLFYCLLCTYNFKGPSMKQVIMQVFLFYPTAKALYRWINLLMCPSPQNESSIKQFYYIFANTSSVSVIHIKKLHLIIKHTICTGHLRETG